MKSKTTMTKRITSMVLCLAMVLTMLPIIGQNATATTISNPRIVSDSSTMSGQKVTWDCIWFGSYPQTEIVADKSQCGTVGQDFETSSDYEVNADLYNSLQNATYDSNGDTTVEGVKYRRLKKSDATYATSDSVTYYNWSDSTTYHYFRYDKIKWRVLNTDGSTALLLADKAVDDQKYNSDFTSITWEKSTIRSWLNGYGSSYNSYGTDYTSKNFINTAFSSSEQGAIKSSSVVNDNNIHNGTAGGNKTTDKIFLLSEKEVYNTDTASSYGFAKESDIYDEARRCKSTIYAKAMGTRSNIGEIAGVEGNCIWWLRSPGDYEDFASIVDCDGFFCDGYGVNYYSIGVRAALKINLSSSILYTYAGTVCSDGSENETDSAIVKATASIKASNYSKTSSTKSQSFYIKPTVKTDGKVSYVSGSSKVKVTSSGKVTIPAKYVGKFSITIMTAETATYKKASKKIYVTVKPSKTALSKLVNLSGRKVKVYWKKNTIGSGYQIQYYRSSSFKSGNKTKTIKSNKTTYTTITSLTKGKTYYFRIRTYKTVSGTKYYSAWSTAKAVKIRK